MSGKSYKSQTYKTNVANALEQGISQLVELGEECREASDNFPNQDHPKAQAFAEVADALENLSLDVDLPEELGSTEVEYAEYVPRRKRHNPSRSSRCSNAVASLQAGLDGMQAWLDDEANATHEKRDEVESLIGEAESAISDAESVEFPGLYG